MSETDKIKEENIKDSPSSKKGSKEKENILTISKKQSHKDNKCILKGIDKEREEAFNNMNPISMTQQEFEYNEGIYSNGIVVKIPYRWMEVNNGS